MDVVVVSVIILAPIILFIINMIIVTARIIMFIMAIIEED